MKKSKVTKQYGIILFGAFLFTLGINQFIIPLNLYNGGGVGIAQIIRTLLIDYTSIPIPSNIDIAGIINFLLNIPILVLAYVSVSHKFFYRTLFSVVSQTILFTLIPIPSLPIIDDLISGCLIGGILTGIGVGITLKAGGSGGGIDVIGVWLCGKNRNFSVGKLTIITNTFIYSVCALLFNLPTAIYSIIYSACSSLVIDKTHQQNIIISATIFTKNKHTKNLITNELERGVTYWDGTGGFTNEDTYVLYTVMSKYEIHELKHILHESDPDAFIIFNEGLQISGNYESRL